MQQHEAEPLDVSHSHDEGFDIVLPSLRSDALLWSLTAVAAAYLGYLIWSEFRQASKTAVIIAAVPSAVDAEKPSDEGKGL